MWPFSRTNRQLRAELDMLQTNFRMQTETLDHAIAVINRKREQMNTLIETMVESQSITNKLIELTTESRSAFVEIMNELTPKSRAETRRMAHKARDMVMRINTTMDGEFPEAVQELVEETLAAQNQEAAA